MTLRRRIGGYKAAHTAKKNKLTLAHRRRFQRVSAKELESRLRYWIETDQIIWTSELFSLVVADAKKQGLHL